MLLEQRVCMENSFGRLKDVLKKICPFFHVFKLNFSFYVFVSFLASHLAIFPRIVTKTNQINYFNIYLFCSRHPGEPGSQPFPHFSPDPEPVLPSGGRTANPRDREPAANPRDREPAAENARNDKTTTTNGGNSSRQAHNTYLVSKGTVRPD